MEDKTHSRAQIKARTKCSSLEKKKDKRIHNYIHFTLHLNTPVWRWRAILLLLTHQADEGYANSEP